MTYSEPKRFAATNDFLYNYADLAAKQKLLEKGLFSEVPKFAVTVTVNISGIDELCVAVEQDYYLNKILYKKLGQINQDPESLDCVMRLVEIYLSALPYKENSKDADVACSFALSNLNLI